MARRTLSFAAFAAASLWMVSASSAQVTTAASYLPSTVSQSNGVGDDLFLGQSFVSSSTDTLFRVGVMVDRSSGSLGTGLTMEIFTANPDNTPTSTLLGSVELTPSEVPDFVTFGDPNDNLTFFNFADQSIQLTSGDRYAIVISSPSATGASGYRLFGLNDASAATDITSLQSIDGGANWSEFFSSFDYPFLVQVPEPATMALLGLGGLTMLRRRR